VRTTSPVNAGTPDDAKWRLFVALRLPEEVRAALAQVQRDLRGLFSPGVASWPKAEHLHLTLRFLGDVDCQRIEELKACLRMPIGMVGRIELHCERLGCFPDLRRPKVVWAWVHDEEERLTALQRMIEIGMEPFTAQPVESRFIGHVTLARLKRIQRSETERIARYVEGAVRHRFGSWTAGEVELIRSERSPTGSCYTTLARVSLES